MTVIDQAADPYAGATAPAMPRRILGPTVTLRPAAETRPMPVLPVNARVPGQASATAPVWVARTDRATIERLLRALKRVDDTALDEAKKTEGETHVSVRTARGAVPFHDAILLSWPTQDRPRLAEAARRRLASLAYPPCDVTLSGHAAAAYIALMRQLDRITGTQGRNWWTRAALPAGGAW